jgi:hypothetical protein
MHQVEVDLAIDHILLAAAHPHVDLHSGRQRTELRGVGLDGRPAHSEFVLGRRAGMGARAADPAALHHGNLFAGTAEVPCEVLSALAAAEDDDIEVFGLRHDYSLLMIL